MDSDIKAQIERFHELILEEELRSIDLKNWQKLFDITDIAEKSDKQNFVYNMMKVTESSVHIGKSLKIELLSNSKEKELYKLKKSLDDVLQRLDVIEEIEWAVLQKGALVEFYEEIDKCDLLNERAGNGGIWEIPDLCELVRIVSRVLINGIESVFDTAEPRGKGKAIGKKTDYLLARNYGRIFDFFTADMENRPQITPFNNTRPEDAPSLQSHDRLVFVNIALEIVNIHLNSEEYRSTKTHIKKGMELDVRFGNNNRG
jgi:hypothetical protein